jgi:death on curing protein
MEEISVAEVQYIAHRLAAELLQWDEPIPAFETRFPNVLESCLATPFQMFGGKQLYPGLVKKAAMLFYLIVKNRPFQNGNKRIAMTTMLLFLLNNGKWLRVVDYRLYKFTIWVAESDPLLRDSVIDAAEKFISTYLVEK